MSGSLRIAGEPLGDRGGSADIEGPQFTPELGRTLRAASSKTAALPLPFAET